MKLIRCDNCGDEDECMSDPFDGNHGVMKGHVLHDKGGFMFSVHLCGKCIEKIFEAFPKLRESTGLYS